VNQAAPQDDASVAAWAKGLYALTVRLLSVTKEDTWGEAALLLRPFVTAPSAASYMATHRLLSLEVRRRSWRGLWIKRSQQELTAVREVVKQTPRWTELLAPLLEGDAEDARAGARLSALFLLLQTREVAEVKAEASIAAMKERLIAERALGERRTRSR
jgi:hypothetical protein